MIKGKKILLAVSGSIAAYKAAFLVRSFIKEGAEVKVVMTPSATHFIAPLSLSTLSKNEVFTDVIDDTSWNNHVEMGLWADAMIVAPATATTIAKMANGIADTIVTAVYLSAKCPVFFAPAMDLDMWHHPSTKANIAKLESYGNIYLEVGKGELASGLSGEGRMMEPDDIIKSLDGFFGRSQRLSDKQVMITAGPTYESLDPVRFIGNHSSGKMGKALAEVCLEEGAEVTLILGPSQIDFRHPRLNIVRVKSAESMYQACKDNYEQADINIFAAAVADYKPQHMADNKIKKNDDSFSLELVRTIDIAKTLGEQKSKNQINVGFALETQNEESNAQKKIAKKNFDFIVLNSLNDKGAGFKTDTNKVTLIDKNNKKQAFELKSKKNVARDIIDKVVSLFK